MSTVEVTVDDQIRTPLLQQHQNVPDEVRRQQTATQRGGGGGGEITPWEDPDESRPDSSASPAPKQQQQRLVSLDVFRGLTVALMILVDDAGKAFPSINHSPWFGVTLADFVMPFFLFVVGVSVSLVFKKVPNRQEATKKVVIRSIRLFLLGLILQGGYFHGRNNLTYGVDLDKIRVMGVLQRISIGYFLTSIMEIWLVNHVVVDSAMAFVRRYYLQFLLAIFLCTLYMLLLYFLYIPSWSFQISSRKAEMLLSPYGSAIQSVNCGVRGSLEPPCNAVGFIDRCVLGQQHLYQRPVYTRTKECSVNSPDYGPLPADAPGWCLAPFDPEGILSSLMAAITCFVGLHYGHILVHFKGQVERAILWFFTSIPLLISGFVLEVIGVPFSKPLYTLSYMFTTAGASGFLLTVIFYIVDVKSIKRPTLLFQWMGMNALIVYALAACDLFPAALQGFYWRSPENNLVNFTERLFQSMFHSEKWGTLAFVLVEILFWGVVAGFLHMKHVYVKL
ncbi:OLC1v1003682C2 [Oldenlandia corymbosa var. corymbosa]|uniref:OLC1v1003682C2 n=1 Tax=Oldenlandia corymbosa var. corymbosa TaxID=529605 RepID=A0AAV1DCY9_OLDCO|nr:OLC1v1003682C2 [Oldenlandia corymbosa var. corymbosa]